VQINGKDRLVADSPRIQEWMHERSRMPILREFHGIAREVDGNIVAAFGYDSFQDTGCAMHLCVDRPDALNRALLAKAFKVPFLQWKYSHIFAIIQRTNAKSLNMAVRLGFIRTGETPDLWIGTMLKDDCRWLRLPE
jgi:hypothetical protein